MVSRTLRRGLFAFTLTSALALAGSAFAHGGVKLEQDECVVQVGPVTVHFIGYQRKGEPEEFCHEIAQTGPTVIALTAAESGRLPDSYITQDLAPATSAPSNPAVDLREIAIGVRIVKDVGDEKEKADVGAATEFYAAPKRYRNATMTFEHHFEKAGAYTAIITVADGKGGEWSSKFPFSVGLYSFAGMFEYILYAIGFFALSGFLWFLLWRRKPEPKLEARAEA